ncbi:interferon-induced protein with tetratricopeptide repeats 5 [Sarcophilus harrisii]|uniref:Interferon induced protein with tetratricopeptide repeats 5 n=1 Tax=Sarcophilus harrisii TaxID=9305 RepID=G3VIF4_SARHA|nr:interferon-induced protein with tetratricopeptide repeats 5 [Sarcophilus harrisii]
MSQMPRNSLKIILRQLKCHFTWNLLKEDIDLLNLEDTIIDQIEFLDMKSKVTLYNLLAYVKHLKGQNEEALRCLKHAEERIQVEHADQVEVRSLVTWGNFAWVYYYMERFPKAQFYADKVQKGYRKLPNSSRYKIECPEVYCEEGWALLKCGRKYYERAKACFEKALKIEPDNPEFNSGFAIAAYRLDDKEYSCQRVSSLDPLRRAVELNPDNTFVMALLALKLQDLKQEAEGERYIREALEKMSSQPYVLRYAAKFYRRQNSPSKALQLLKIALQATPTSAFLHHQIGVCYKVLMILVKQSTKKRPREKEKEKRELIQSAIFHFRAAMEQNSMFVFAYTDLANMYAEAGQYEKAEDVFQKALHLQHVTDENKQQVHFHYGRFQETHRKSEDAAIHHYLEGVKIKVESSITSKLISALQRLATRRLYENAVDVKSWGALGFIHKLKGQKRQAIECYQRALKLDPENGDYISALFELRLSF